MILKSDWKSRCYGECILDNDQWKIVYQDEKLIGIDEKKLAVEGNKICENLLHEGLAQFS